MSYDTKIGATKVYYSVWNMACPSRTSPNIPPSFGRIRAFEVDVCLITESTLHLPIRLSHCGLPKLQRPIQLRSPTRYTAKCGKLGVASTGFVGISGFPTKLVTHAPDPTSISVTGCISQSKWQLPVSNLELDRLQYQFASWKLVREVYLFSLPVGGLASVVAIPVLKCIFLRL